jgi:hypothetical protein
MKYTFIPPIFLLLISVIANAQVAVQYRYSDDFCSTSIILLPNGIYNMLNGCEKSDRLAVGTWSQSLDTLFFREIDSSFNVIDTIIASKTGNDDLTVRVFDKKGNNVTSKYIVAQYLEDGNAYTMDLDANQKECHDMRRPGSAIKITVLQKSLGRLVGTKTSDADTYEIYLNEKVDWILYKGSQWSSMGNFKLVKKEDALVPIRPMPFILGSHYDIEKDPGMFKEQKSL